MRPRKHLDCVKGHGKEVREGSGRERNLPPSAFEVGVSYRQVVSERVGKGGWKSARRTYFLSPEAAPGYSQACPCPALCTRRGWGWVGRGSSRGGAWGGGRRAESHRQASAQVEDVLVMPRPWKNTSASLPLSTSMCRQGPEQPPSWTASRIPNPACVFQRK